MSKGVPQGSGLSSLLFNIFVRELPNSCTSEVVQFADDVTSSEASKDLNEVITVLGASFASIAEFCADKGLSVNANKTQLVVFKQPARRLPPECEIVIEDVSIKPAPFVKLLGVHLDQHLTMTTHIDKTVKKCHGVLGALSKASSVLSCKLVKLAYMSLVRSHLEYSSCILSLASSTQPHKLDIVQKMGARLNLGAPRFAHSEPLLSSLQLALLSERRTEHMIKFMTAILEGQGHPAFSTFFTEKDISSIECGFTPRTAFGRKTFQVRGMTDYNNWLAQP